MTRSDLVEELAARFGQLTHKDAEYAVKTILDAMAGSLAKGQRIEIRGFGSFDLNYRPPRVGRNPKSGSSVVVPEKYVPHFKAGKELRERVRTRLAEAARFFRDETPAPDSLIAELRDQYLPEQWPGCANRLDIAAQWMDEAAVSTIHSWCQRMLREHAFDSGSLFTQTLETDHSELLGQVMRDYWRGFCYCMQGDALAWVRSHWVSPEALLPRVRALFGRSRADENGPEPQALIETVAQQRADLLRQLKAPWAQWAARSGSTARKGSRIRAAASSSLPKAG